MWAGFMLLDRFNFKEWAYWGHLIKKLQNTWIKYALDWLLAKNMLLTVY